MNNDLDWFIILMIALVVIAFVFGTAVGAWLALEYHWYKKFGKKEGEDKSDAQ